MTKANVRPISGLPLAAAPDGTETFPVVQQGAAVAMTIDRVAALAVQRFNVVLPPIPKYQAFSASLAEFGAYGTEADESAAIRLAAASGARVYCAPPRGRFYSCQGIEFDNGTIFEGDTNTRAQFKLLPNATQDLFLSKNYWRNVNRLLTGTSLGGATTIQMTADSKAGIVENAPLFILLDNDSLHVCNARLSGTSATTVGLSVAIPAGRSAPHGNPFYDMFAGWGPTGFGVRNLFLNGNQAGQRPGQDNIAIVTPTTIAPYVPGAAGYAITMHPITYPRTIVSLNADGSYTAKGSYRINSYVEIYCAADETANEFYVYGRQATNRVAKVNYDDTQQPRIVVPGGPAGSIVRAKIDINEVTGLYCKNVPAGEVRFGMPDGPGTGNGLLFYGTYFLIDRMLIENCKGKGWRTDWTAAGGGMTTPYKSQQAFVRDVDTHFCDGGPWLHNGPNDTTIANSICNFGRGDGGYVGWLGGGTVIRGGHISGANSGVPQGSSDGFDYFNRSEMVIEPIHALKIEADSVTVLEMKLEEGTKSQACLRANNAKILGGRLFFIDSAAGAQATCGIQIGEIGWSACTAYELDTKLTDLGCGIRVVNDGGWGKGRLVGFKGDLAATCIPLAGTLVSGINASDIEIDIVGATPKRFAWSSQAVEIDAIIAAQTGTIGAYTAKHRYLVQGARVTESLRVTITNVGSAAGGFLRYVPPAPIAPVPGVSFTQAGHRSSDLAMMHWTYRAGDASGYIALYNGGFTITADTYAFSGTRERLC